MVKMDIIRPTPVCNSICSISVLKACNEPMHKVMSKQPLIVNVVFNCDFDMLCLTLHFLSLGLFQYYVHSGLLIQQP